MTSPHTPITRAHKRTPVAIEVIVNGVLNQIEGRICDLSEGGARIERRVPLLPLSRDEIHLQRLKRGLALYRLVFGQPRQEELLTHLGDLDEEQRQAAVAKWRIDLTPPALPDQSED